MVENIHAYSELVAHAGHTVRIVTADGANKLASIVCDCGATLMEHSAAYEQYLEKKAPAKLVCQNGCGNEYSASHGDYWYLAPTDAHKCGECGEPLALVSPTGRVVTEQATQGDLVNWDREHGHI